MGGEKIDSSRTYYTALFVVDGEYSQLQVAISLPVLAAVRNAY